MASTPKADPARHGAEDPSMDDILASIRRILSEDQPSASVSPVPPPPTPAPPSSSDSDVLVLDSSMMLPDAPIGAPLEGGAPTGGLPSPAPSSSSLVSPETARAAAASIAGLVRTLAANGVPQPQTGGLTIEDVVRGELRPMLKEWMDANLPQLVERLVRAELERVIGGATP
jgi:cell pole-organizing protein PopZ